MSYHKEDWHQAAIKLQSLGESGRQIAEMLGVPRSTVGDFLRQYNEVLHAAAEDEPNSRFDDEGHDNNVILFISDMHIPYQHRKMFEFLAGLKKRYNPTRVICVGDELDKHALSFHDSDPDLDSAGPELEKSLPAIARLHEMFPKMDLIDSNHGSMVYRKAKHHGIPRKYIKSYNDVLGVGEGWKWHMDLTITLPDHQKVYVHHGKSADAVKTSQAMSMSHVCGHFHESFGIRYWSNPTALYWGMNIGCLINDSSLAFAYNNTNLKRPIIGTGLIVDGYPILEPMPL